MAELLSLRTLVPALKAAAEPTRLRILLLLLDGELNVKELTQILGQSQPRLSRHLKLLSEAGLLERFREGSWVYFHVSDRTEGGRLTRDLLAAVDRSDPELRRDRERAEALKKEREAAAQFYFRDHAADWDRIRALHVAEQDVEAAILGAIGPGPFKMLVDLGTGTGRMLELLAGRYERGLGLDVNPSMLAYARSKLAAGGHGRAEVRHGDLYALALGNGSADAVIMHQVLHFLSEPALAVGEAARVLAPGGRLVIVDFAPHELEYLREAHAHERLGFARDQINDWLAASGLKVTSTRDLKPSSSAATPMLTVSLWVAEQARTASRGLRDEAQLTLEGSRS